MRRSTIPRLVLLVHVKAEVAAVREKAVRQEAVRSRGDIIEMNWDQIADRWRPGLVNKLRDHYGLSEEEARRKVETWLAWLKGLSNP
jgi:hypothetical protein